MEMWAAVATVETMTMVATIATVAILVTSGVATLFSWNPRQVSRDLAMTFAAPLVWGWPLHLCSTASSEATGVRSAVAALLLASFDVVVNAGDTQRWAARVLCAFIIINWASRSRSRYRWSALLKSYLIGVQFVGGHRLVCETLAALGVDVDHRRLYDHLLLIVCWIDVASAIFTQVCDTVPSTCDQELVE